MTKTTAASDVDVAAVAAAIYAEDPVAVVEAYSAFGHELVAFRSADEFCAYAHALRCSARHLHVAVLYPDMAGTLTASRINRDPSKCGGHTFRYQALGWGLVWVHLSFSPTDPLGTFISANSEKRAITWAPTAPGLELPSTWHWPAVARHLRRLRRALRLADRFTVR